MDTLKILLVSIIQGITELLPISSSAHIILFGTLLKIDITSALLVLFHFGTTLAIILFFWKKIFYKLFQFIQYKNIDTRLLEEESYYL